GQQPGQRHAAQAQGVLREKLAARAKIKSGHRPAPYSTYKNSLVLSSIWHRLTSASTGPSGAALAGGAPAVFGAVPVRATAGPAEPPACSARNASARESSSGCGARAKANCQAASTWLAGSLGASLRTRAAKYPACCKMKSLFMSISDCVA